MSVATLKAKSKEDPVKAELFAKVGDISGLDLMHNAVLVVTYIEPEFKTLSNGMKFYNTDGRRKESEYQGKVGLVVAVGPGAFQDDANNKFHGKSVKVGDWVAYRAAHGWQLTINGEHCRRLEDVNIVAKIDKPELVY